MIITVAGVSGCATHRSGSGGLHAVGAATPAAGGSSSPSPDATSTPSGTPTPTSTGPVTVSVHVSAVTGSYIGVCQPPTTATKFKAVITVSHTPATVHFRWTTSNGGDSDPSTQIVTFSAGGSRSVTVYHHEASYPPGPYPASANDWAAVKLIGYGNATSNHVAFSIKCVPFTVRVSGVVTHYDGSCPPPPSGSTAITLSGVITVSSPLSVTFHWRSSNGGDSDTTVTTVSIAPGTPYTFHHYEYFYPGAPYPATKNDWIAVDASADAYSAQSNHVPIKITCES
jgi:hypothetical protein